jgi:ArsR family transcriptional regulator
MTEESGLDDLFNILGNETRRRILQLLAEEPKYLLQLARNMSVTQQAILKHLNILESCGIVTSYEAKSDLAAPPRKYYGLAKSLCLSIGLTPNIVDFVAREIPREVDVSKLLPPKLLELQKQVKQLESNKDPVEAINLSNHLTSEINKQITDLKNAEIFLRNLRQRVAEKAHTVIRETFDSPLERRLLYFTLGSEGSVNIASLSEMLDVREKELEEALKTVRKRLLLDLMIE